MKIINDLSDEMNLVVNYPWYDKQGFCSVTNLLNPIRIFHLERRHYDELEACASELIVPSFGSIFHNGMEFVLSGQEKYSTEVRMLMPINIGGNIVTLSGKFDCIKVDEENNQIKIIDWKETSVYKIVKSSSIREWKLQLNSYLLMLSNEETVFKGNEKDVRLAKIAREMLKAGCKVEAEVQYRARDWRRGEALQARYNNRFYPKNCGVVEIYLMTKEDITKFITEHVAALIYWEKEKDDSLPLCTAEERWQRVEAYAVMKEGVGRAKRVFKVNDFEKEEDAENAALKFIDEKSNKTGLYVEKRETASLRCLEYCPVREKCSFYKIISADNEGEL